MVKMTQHRSIGGKIFRLSTSWQTKGRAQQEAKRMRGTGYKVRVFKDRLGGYGVFVAK